MLFTMSMDKNSRVRVCVRAHMRSLYRAGAVERAELTSPEPVPAVCRMEFSGWSWPQLE